jgi:hypothetical protein
VTSLYDSPQCACNADRIGTVETYRNHV